MTTRITEFCLESGSADACGGGAPSRRTVLKAGAATLELGVIGFGRLRFPAPAWAQDAASPTADVCVLTPGLTEGPY